MDKLFRLTIIFLVAISLVIATYVVFRAISSWQQGYSWQEMDWHQRGKTSVADFFAASDIGKRELIQNGKVCTEYYAYKDGLSVKVVCPK